jgi:hypothetical protein
MKTLILLALAFLCSGLCAAQTVPAEQTAPGVVVLESSFRGRPTGNPRLDEDPLLALEDQQESERIRTEVSRKNAIRVSAGKLTEPLPSRNAPDRPALPRAAYPYLYTYKSKIMNTGVKKISGIMWEYVLTEPSTGRELGRHQFRSKVSVGPGKRQTLYGYSTLSPISTVDARAAGEENAQLSGQVVIKAIIYKDKSFWERPRQQ